MKDGDGNALVGLDLCTMKEARFNRDDDERVEGEGDNDVVNTNTFQNWFALMELEIAGALMKRGEWEQKR